VHDDHVRIESLDEDELILKVLNNQIQILIDSTEANQKALKKLKESLEALRNYHSREVIRNVLDNINPKPF
jgi:hypothetical protein